MLKQALEYNNMGMSVIPIKPDKKCYIKWRGCQDVRPTETQLREWWQRWPNANTGIVTGKISGIDAIDVDSQEAWETLNDFHLETGFISPTYKTPNKGYQIWVKHRNGLPNTSDVIKQIVPGVDIRTTGGYTVAPLSYCEYDKHGQHIKGSHRWMDGLSPKQVGFSDWPSSLYQTILQGFGSSSILLTTSNSKNNANELLHITNRNIRNISFEEGGRDDSIFHLIWHLKKSGMSREEIEIYAKFVALNCNPPFPEDEIQIKINSAFERKTRSDNGLTDAIRSFLDVTKGNFSVTECEQTVANVTNGVDRASIRAILHRMAKEKKVIQRDPNRVGVFKKIETDCEVIDFLNCDIKPIGMKLPLGLDELVEIYPGNIIIVAGVSNMGKTTFMLDIIYRNMLDMEVWYFNSEMDGQELKKRLRDFKAVQRLEDWKFKSRDVPDDIEFHIAKGKGKLNIIDYIEIHEDFFKLGGIIKRIHDNLDGAVAIIALQKNPGTAVARGGFGTIDKARLALNIESGVCEIYKAKNWASRMNPNKRRRKFDIVDGWDLSGRGGWYTE